MGIFHFEFLKTLWAINYNQRVFFIGENILLHLCYRAPKWSILSMNHAFFRLGKNGIEILFYRIRFLDVFVMLRWLRRIALFREFSWALR